MEKKKNRYFEEVALDLLEFCGGQLSQDGIVNFWKRETERGSRLSEDAKKRIMLIALNYLINP